MSAALVTCDGFDDDFGTEGEVNSFSDEISVLFRCKTDSSFHGEFSCEIDGEGNLVEIGADPHPVGISGGEVAGIAGVAVAVIVLALAIETLPGALIAHYGFGLTWGPSLGIGFGAAAGLHMLGAAFAPHPVEPPPAGIRAGSPVHKAFPELKLLPVKAGVVHTAPKKK